MNSAPVIHERFMNDSRIIPPRVGGGVGEGGGCGAIHASRLTTRDSRPVDNATTPTARHRRAWMGQSR